MHFRLLLPRAALAAALVGCITSSWAQFDPTTVVVEPDAIARQFPDPGVSYDTPGFAQGRQDFTAHAEVFAFIAELKQRSPQVDVETIGHSQEGRAMALLVLAGPRGFNPALPTVMVLGQQHGNEPAGGEAALVLAQSLATERHALLDKVNVLIVPRANPDGAEHFRRVSASGIDVNRDHLLVRTPEALAITAAVQRYRPQVVLDLHEFTVAGRWVAKFGTMMRQDALLQAATVGNLSPQIQSTQTRYMDAARAAIEGAGQRVFDYHTTSPNPNDKVVSMGGVNVDTARNVGGLRNAVSLLLETRGVGLGRAHYKRRVQAHVVAALAVIETAASDGRSLVQTSREAGENAARQACRGEMTVAVRQTPQRRTLNFLDARSGEPRDIDVEWRSSLHLTLERERARPCGYLIAAEQGTAVTRLRTLGIEVYTLDKAATKTAWEVENYVVESEASGQREDGRGAIADGEDIRALRVSTAAGRVTPTPGTFYVPLNQPLAGLASAALEPDSQNSFAANRILDISEGQLQRVTRAPQGEIYCSASSSARACAAAKSRSPE